MSTAMSKAWLACGVLALLGGTPSMAQAAAPVIAVRLVMTDVQGTPVMKTDLQGNILARYDYRPYGAQQSGPVEAGPGYTGHVNDPDTGLVYMQQRYYDPDVGRFLSVDPVGVSPASLSHFNRYNYASNNPIVNMDPDGRDDVCMGNMQCEGGGVRLHNGDGSAGSDNSNQDVSGSSGSSSVASIPARTPKSMEKYFKSTDRMSRLSAVLAIMDYYKIDDSGINCCSYTLSLDGYNAQMNPDGNLDIGARLFTHSFGLIGAILYHEVGVHWRLQFANNAILNNGQASNMREVQAFDYETSKSSIQRFGLTPAEVRLELGKRSIYYNLLTPSNASLVSKGIYLPAPKYEY